MSNTFKRPMFRKGGDVGGGIMDNVVQRGQYAKSNAEEFKGLSIGEKLKIVDDVAGTSKLDDPITSFLLQVGPQIVKQTGGGGLIPNLLLASEKPVQSLLKDRRSERATKRAIALDFVKDLSDSDKIALQKQINYLMSEEGGGYDREEALNRLKPLYRKRGDPEETALKDKREVIDSIISVTSNMYGTPTIDKMQGELIYEDIMKFKEQNPEAYSDFMRIKGKNKFVFASGEYDGNLSQGANILKNSSLTKIPEGIPVYDISSGKFIIKQGNIIKEYVSETIEE